jgi:hypothetical protein
MDCRVKPGNDEDYFLANPTTFVLRGRMHEVDA